MIISAYSKSSNSSGFHPISQKFYDIICEIIVSKTVRGIFLIFCPSSFIDNFIVKSDFWEPWNHAKLKSQDPFIFKKFPYTVLKIISAQIRWKNFFFEKFFFQGLGAFFSKPLTWASFFSTQNLFYIFFQVWLFDFNIVLKTCFKNLFRKTVKN